MHHFFTTPEEIGEEYIRITGPDVNHIRNVLRMKLGETMLISDGQGKDYCCELAELGESEVLAKITDAEYEGRYVNFIYFMDFRSQIRWN